MPKHTLCLCVLLLLTAAVRVSAQGSAPAAAAPSGSAASAVEPAVSPPASAWDVSSNLRASFGWRENVTVSSVYALNRAFWRGEADTFFIRPWGKQWQLIGYMSGDVLRYFNAPEFAATDGTVRVNGEEQWVADLMARWQPTARLRTTLKGVGFLEETFVDPSQSEGEPLPATAVRFTGGYVMLAQRIALPGGFALEPSLQEKKIHYKRGYRGDYTESRPGAVLEWKRNDLFVLTAAWYDHLRHYAYLAPATGGHALRNRLLSLRQREAELKASSTFEAHGKWTIAVTGGGLRNRDRVNGFLDYNQKRIELEWGWERNGWRLTTSGEARRLDYLQQSVGLGIVQTPRLAEVYELSARIEHDLSPQWMVFIENRWERNRSNITEDPDFRFTYRTNTSQIGIQRAF